MTEHSRRQVLRIGAGGLAAALAGCAGDPTTGSTTGSSGSSTQFTPWLSSHRTGARTNATPDTAPEGPLEAQWTLGPDGLKPSVLTAPLVTADAVCGVTLDGVVGASRQDGSQLFIADYDTARSAFIHDVVLVSRPTEDPRILGLRTTDGSRAWLSTLPGATDHEYTKLHLYPVENRLVYSVAFDQGNPDGWGTEFGALSLADRSQLRRERIRDESGETIVRGAVADPSADRVFVARVALNKFRRPADEAEPTIEAYDLASGQRRWRVETYGFPLAAHDGRLFVGLPDNNVITGQDLTGMAALRTDSGETLWRRDEEPPRIYRTAVGNGLAVDDSGLYIAHEQSVLGLDPADGTTQWQYPTSEPVITAPVAAANAVVAGSKRRLHVVSKSDGTQLNTSGVDAPRVQGGITGHVSVADGTIYAGTSQGLRAYSAA